MSPLDQSMLGISVQNKGILKIPENEVLVSCLSKQAVLLCNKKDITAEVSQPKYTSPKACQAASEYLQTSPAQKNKTNQKEHPYKTYFK